MAATMSSPWSKKPGAWALDAEEHEAELLQEQKPNGNRDVAAESVIADFPSLSAAATTKTKKKKGQTISLSEFATYGGPKPFQAGQPKGLTHEDLMSLPTGPRERTAEELDRSRLGGGFRNYGDRGSRYTSGEDSSSRWGSSRVSSEEGRKPGGFGRESGRESGPSRADEIDDWAAMKKSSVGNGFERKERGGFFDSQSRADESNNWASNKSFVPSEGRRIGSNGGGFERERRGGFERSLSNGGGADSDNWGKKEDSDNWGKKKDDSDNWGKNKEETGSGIVGGRPRLVLQRRTLPVTNEKQESPAAVEKPKGSNPFGDARPREQVLAEKGQDWKDIDEKLESMKLKEAGEKGDRSSSFGKKNYGGVNSPENQRSWRKPDSVDSHPQSAEKSDSGHDAEM